MFGFNTVSLDAKGRLSIPARYRTDFKKQNQTNIVITKDPQYPSLKIYPGREWSKISTKLESLQGLDPIVRNIQWTILGNAYQTDIDVDGRTSNGSSMTINQSGNNKSYTGSFWCGGASCSMTVNQ